MRYFFITIVIVAVIALAGGAFFIFISKGFTATPATVSSYNATTTARDMAPSGREIPAGFSEYRTVQYRFSLLYPDELSVKEIPEQGNAITITFENVDKAEGFQIFILPYYYPQVTPERFKQDEPSGVRDNLTEIKINGATGAAFYGKSAALGDTYELWFIHNGYLYEVTSLKPLNTWLNPIMQTWQFI